MAVVTGNSRTPLHIIPFFIFFHVLMLHKGLVLAGFGIKMKFRVILDVQWLIPPAVTTTVMTPKVVGHVDLLFIEI